MKLVNVLFVSFAALVLLSIAIPAFADQAPARLSSPAGRPAIMPEGANIVMSSGDKAAYTGTLRIYIVEPTSRWRAADNRKYEMGFLEFATVEALDVPDNGIYQHTYHWDGAAHSWLVTEGNIKAIAVVFDDTPHSTDAYPPYGYMFNAYYVDAAAGAVPGQIDSSYVGGSFTHSVFVEEGTATWCGWCPYVRDQLMEISENPNYHLLFAAMVDDVNDNASTRLGQLNTAAFPTAYFDGGFDVVVGADTSSSAYLINAMNAAAARDNGGLRLKTAVEWTGVSQMDIRIAIGNNVDPNNAPTDAQIVSGVSETNPDTSAEYSAQASDADAGDLWYQWDWGDGNVSEWIGPYEDGTPCTLNYAYESTGDFNVTVRAKDYWGGMTDWSDAHAVSVVSPTCCVGLRGNVDGIGSDAPTLGDLSALIDVLFISLTPPVCAAEANVDGIGPDDPSGVTLGDLSALIDVLFISLNPPPACP